VAVTQFGNRSEYPASYWPIEVAQVLLGASGENDAPFVALN